MSAILLSLEKMNGNSDAIEGVFNNAVEILTLITNPIVLSVEIAPPKAVTEGMTYAINTNPVGDWTGFAGCLTYASVNSASNDVTWMCVRAYACISPSGVYLWNGTAWNLL